MNEIKMVDLKSQYLKIKEEIDSAISKVIDSTAFINGPEVKEFQKDLEAYMGVKHAIACNSGTDALQIALMALDLKPGDEVITSDFTFVATVEVIKLLGLVPVLVDVESDTFNISLVEIEKAITPKTRAIIPVHLFGQSSDIEGVMEIAKKQDLHVVEDLAQAIGAEYHFKNGKKKKVGTIGDIGCTSFFPSKNLGCYGDGGALFTNNDELAKKLRLIVNHGMKVRYYHDSIGVNSRLDTIQAAILKVKLAQLDDYNRARQEAASYYDKAFANHPNLITPYRSENSTHIFHQYTLVTKGIDRASLIEFLQGKGVPAMIYYPVPLHRQKAYQDDRYIDEAFPVTNKLSDSVISLPMHTELSEEQLRLITESVLEFCNK